VGYIYTDRPVYRPTHEVDFKGIVRAQDGAASSVWRSGPHHGGGGGRESKDCLPAETSPVSIREVSTARSPSARWRRSALTELPRNIGDKSITEHLKSRNTRSRNMRLQFRPTRHGICKATRFRAPSARGLFWRSRIRGKVKYSIFRSGYQFPYWRILWGDDEFDSDDEGIDTGDYFGEEIKQGTGQLDADGVMHVSLPTEIDPHQRDYTYRIESSRHRRQQSGDHRWHSVTVTYSTVVGPHGDGSAMVTRPVSRRK